MNARAFPCVPHDLVGRVVGMEYGLTKREWFAGMALQGMLGDPERNGTIETYALEAARFADALMKELNK